MDKQAIGKFVANLSHQLFTHTHTLSVHKHTFKTLIVRERERERVCVCVCERERERERERDYLSGNESHSDVLFLLLTSSALHNLQYKGLVRWNSWKSRCIPCSHPMNVVHACTLACL